MRQSPRCNSKIHGRSLFPRRWVKTCQKRVIEAATVLKGTWKIGASVQSWDADVLDNIERSNISLDAYRQFIDFVNDQGPDAEPYTELILPGFPVTAYKNIFNRCARVSRAATKTSVFIKRSCCTAPAWPAQQPGTDSTFAPSFALFLGAPVFTNSGPSTFQLPKSRKLSSRPRTFPSTTTFRVEKWTFSSETFFQPGHVRGDFPLRVRTEHFGVRHLAIPSFSRRTISQFHKSHLRGLRARNDRGPVRELGGRQFHGQDSRVSGTLSGR